jgi:hypothetical protein
MQTLCLSVFIVLFVFGMIFIVDEHLKTLLICLLIKSFGLVASSSIISMFRTASSILRLKHSSAASKNERYDKFLVVY